MLFGRFVIVGCAVAASFTPAASAQVNVALNRPVSVVAGAAEGGDVATLTDGIFLPREQFWQTDTVWWTGFDAAFQIDLGGVFSVESAAVQCDDNDAYVLLYHNLDTDLFEVLWDVPNFDEFGSGMQTRPDPENDAARFVFPGGPVVTDALRFAAVSGDGLNAVSEIQVFGVPSPGAALFFAAAALAARRRR